ncbi:hypothetical protein L6164_021806 [Bauhinia variegata]|uniref:Uncharacterized protein n=1 Tax=Bauhinia variegata TaxID=167791 RepID=A0ACB9MEX5_BAUVA|nr:hypothetical protein L6164_021806 [Bauhinia variegata]
MRALCFSSSQKSGMEELKGDPKFESEPRGTVMDDGRVALFLLSRSRTAGFHGRCVWGKDPGIAKSKEEPCKRKAAVIPGDTASTSHPARKTKLQMKGKMKKKAKVESFEEKLLKEIQKLRKEIEELRAENRELTQRFHRLEKSLKHQIDGPAHQHLLRLPLRMKLLAAALTNYLL